MPIHATHCIYVESIAVRMNKIVIICDRGQVPACGFRHAHGIEPNKFCAILNSNCGIARAECSTLILAHRSLLALFWCARCSNITGETDTERRIARRFPPAYSSHISRRARVCVYGSVELLFSMRFS